MSRMIEEFIPMADLEFYPILYFSRALLVAGLTVYFIFMLDSIFLLDNNSQRQRSDRWRIGLAATMCAYSSVQFALTFNHGSLVANHIFVPVIYLIGSLGILAYAHLFKRFMWGAKILIPGISFFSALNIVCALLTLIYAALYGEGLGWDAVRDDTITNSLVLASLGPYQFQPVSIGLVVVACALIATVMSLVGFIGGMITGLNSDPYIRFGVIFSLCATLFEVLMPILAPAYMFTIYFASNLPELARSSYLARRKLVLDSSNREREILLALSSSMNHKLQKPLDLIQKTIVLAIVREDLTGLKELQKQVFEMADLIKNYDKVALSELERQESFKIE